MWKSKRALGLILATAFSLCACIDTGALKDGYDLGDASVTYCNSTTEAQRVVLRGSLDALAATQGFSVGVDYCKAFKTLQDGYTVGDVTAVWCGATDAKVRAQVRVAFAPLFETEGIELSDAYCKVAGYVLSPKKEPE